MRKANNVSLVTTCEATDFRQAQSVVVIGDEVTNITVPGLLLEAAIQVDNTRYLLFLTDDVIFEESLTIVLIDIRQGVKEIVRIGQMWATGIFENLSISTEQVRFRFLGEGEWVVEISSAPRLRLPFFSDPAGVQRAPGWQKYITLAYMK
ncbi:hypothetical protein GA0061071_11274 [Kosakonia oryzendophytica]|uniref:Uncharacterized protein n=1 Tax=Kosakonia oryzendophytica TaxID=1005665 RepID=A0A1C4DH15_9ENTR|nr:hypothetical protein [Kosakonia oryzendophytica]SCC30672.1 hypothetical protein GA0061071_11274 [Kosakonia oryzendophytica]